MTYSKEWEDIENKTKRLRIPGGWLVKANYAIGNGPGVGAGTSIIFISDPNGEWKL